MAASLDFAVAATEWRFNFRRANSSCSLSFPKIRSGRIRAVRENQTIIRCDVCDHLPTVDVARVRITDAGRRELAERAK
jgi:hypothetical protein